MEVEGEEAAGVAEEEGVGAEGAVEQVEGRMEVATHEKGVGCGREAEIGEGGAVAEACASYWSK